MLIKLILTNTPCQHEPDGFCGCCKCDNTGSIQKLHMIVNCTKDDSKRINSAAMLDILAYASRKFGIEPEKTFDLEIKPLS